MGTPCKQVLGNLAVGQGYLELDSVPDPSTPPANKGRLYTKGDAGRVYWRTVDNTCLGLGSSGKHLYIKKDFENLVNTNSSHWNDVVGPSINPSSSSVTSYKTLRMRRFLNGSNSGATWIHESDRDVPSLKFTLVCRHQTVSSTTFNIKIYHREITGNGDPPSNGWTGQASTITMAQNNDLQRISITHSTSNLVSDGIYQFVILRYDGDDAGYWELFSVHMEPA